MVGIELTAQKNYGPADDAICSGIRGVLVRLTTCKKLTNSLPKLSLITWVTQGPAVKVDQVTAVEKKCLISCPQFPDWSVVVEIFYWWKNPWSPFVVVRVCEITFRKDYKKKAVDDDVSLLFFKY